VTPGPALPPPRPLALPLALAGAALAALAIGLGGKDFDSVQRTVGLAGASLSALAAVLALRRARESPAERVGWLLLGGAHLVWTAALVVVARAGLGLVDPSAGGAYLALVLAAQAIGLLALLAWPWRWRRSGHHLQNLLGILLFVGSLTLLLWIAGSWRVGLRAGAFPNTILLGLSTRFAVWGGVGLYLLFEDPRRGRGPLGWILSGILGGAFSLTLLQILVTTGQPPPGPWFALALLPMVSACVAAWSRAPVETGDPAPAPRPRRLDLVVYLPYVTAGAILVGAQLVEPDRLSGPSVGFVALTALLVARQLLLLRELQASERYLSERVEARTRALEEVQAAVIRTERMNVVGALGAGLAHDLNNLLGAVQNACELLGEQAAAGTPPDPEAVRDLRLAASRAAAMTGRLMRLARSGEEDGARPVDLPALLAGSASLVRLLVPRDVAVEYPADGAELVVRSTASRIEQILVNLVSNARDAVGAGGRITIALARANGGAELRVHDSGPGIPPEIRAHLFEPLFTTKPPGKGTGLGLVAVRALAEADGGRVSVESAPGRGTTFAVWWPLADGPGAG